MQDEDDRILQELRQLCVREYEPNYAQFRNIFIE